MIRMKYDQFHTINDLINLQSQQCINTEWSQKDITLFINMSVFLSIFLTICVYIYLSIFLTLSSFCLPDYLSYRYLYTIFPGVHQLSQNMLVIFWVRDEYIQTLSDLTRAVIYPVLIVLIIHFKGYNSKFRPNKFYLFYHYLCKLIVVINSLALEECLFSCNTFTYTWPVVPSISATKDPNFLTNFFVRIFFCSTSRLN